MAALYYLAREAEQIHRPEASKLIRQTIIDIDMMTEATSASDRNRAVTSRGTCTVLEFFDCYLRASPAARADFLRSLSEGVGVS